MEENNDESELSNRAGQLYGKLKKGIEFPHQDDAKYRGKTRESDYKRDYKHALEELLQKIKEKLADTENSNPDHEALKFLFADLTQRGGKRGRKTRKHTRKSKRRSRRR